MVQDMRNLRKKRCVLTPRFRKYNLVNGLFSRLPWGSKVFAICGWYDGKEAFTFKATELAFEVLSGEPGIRPAPYLASRGMKWLQVYDERGMNDGTLREHIVTSYELVVANLTRKTRTDLGV